MNKHQDIQIDPTPAEEKILITLLKWVYPTQGGRPARPFDISRASGISYSHTHLCLKTLKADGFVTKSPTGQYVITDVMKASELLSAVAAKAIDKECEEQEKNDPYKEK